MERAPEVRQSALDAVEDVEPDRLRERIGSRIEDGSMAPGVLTILSARAVEPSVPVESVLERAAGVQLIYEGLRLTRTLAHEEPWGIPDGPASAAETLDADLDILAADILVARGFYLLARTEAAETAVETVRAFGRDQTVRRETDDPSLDRNLEADVFELAAVAGTTAAGGRAPVRLREHASDLAPTDGAELPGAFPEGLADSIARLAADSVGGEEVPTSADHW